MTVSSLLEFTQQVNKAYSSLCEPLCQSFGISRTSFDILLFLANNPTLYTAKDISIFKNIKPNVVSIHVDQMVHDGYLIRESVPEDRRKIRLRYTEKAHAIIRQGQQMQKDFYQCLIRGLTPQELTAFKHCFDVIIQNAETLPKLCKPSGR